MASNPVPVNPSPDGPVSTNQMPASRVTEIIGTVTSVAAAIEQLIAGSGVGGTLNLAQVEQLTSLFGNLAGVAIQAAHEVMGKPVTPESVLALMPATTPLVNPSGSL